MNHFLPARACNSPEILGEPSLAWLVESSCCGIRVSLCFLSYVSFARSDRCADKCTRFYADAPCLGDSLVVIILFVVVELGVMLETHAFRSQLGCVIDV